MGRWNAGNVVAGLAIAGAVGAVAWLKVRDAREADLEAARQRGRESAARHSAPFRDEWFFERDTPACPTKTALDRSTKLAADQEAFAQHFHAAGCTVWPAGEKVAIVERDWLFCEVAYRGRTGWVHCEHLGRR